MADLQYDLPLPLKQLKMHVYFIKRLSSMRFKMPNVYLYENICSHDNVIKLHLFNPLFTGQVINRIQE